MKAYWFKFQVDDKTAFVGLAVGANDGDVMWAIDEVGDPYSAEVIKAKFGSQTTKKELTEDGWVTVDGEGSEYEPDIGDKRWSKKEWGEFYPFTAK